MAGLLMAGGLALIPLLGIAYIILNGNLFSVDGLFMSLILLTISGIFGLNLLLELKQRRARAQGGTSLTPARAAAAAVRGRSRVATAGAPGNTVRESGLVENVAFFEAQVGQPDKSLVTLRPPNGGQPKLILFAGDLRNALPVGKRVKITYTAGNGASNLVAVGD